METGVISPAGNQMSRQHEFGEGTSQPGRYPTTRSTSSRAAHGGARPKEKQTIANVGTQSWRPSKDTYNTDGEDEKSGDDEPSRQLPRRSPRFLASLPQGGSSDEAQSPDRKRRSQTDLTEPQSPKHIRASWKPHEDPNDESNTSSRWPDPEPVHPDREVKVGFLKQLQTFLLKGF